eukprot:gnl/Trimastix_PCT/634.p2 GENE.gnl/Trimastix_PCT/634~~gnl/Trimastix_PCT/634.p2  ORF type:complete len:212 (+),score=63.30 gnl/Trimastix_PCT/634:609-1244(+)
MTETHPRFSLDFFRRRSVRVFRPDAPPKEDIQAIIDAAYLAPSGHNKQPWRFYVCKYDHPAVQRSKVTAKAFAQEKYNTDFQKIADSVGLELNEDPIYYQAPIIIYVVACGGFPNIQQLDCGLAIQNMLLAAEHRGLATAPVFMACYGKEEIMAELAPHRATLDAQDAAPERIVDKPEELLLAICVGYRDAPRDSDRVMPRNTNKALFLYE